MHIIDATNVNEAWHDAKLFLNAGAVRRPSRVGEVLELEDPMTTKFRKPCQRVLFDAKRDANPFFHFFEGLWMLAGRNDVAWISQFNQRMMSYSDDGVTYHAAYGHRWRQHFHTWKDARTLGSLDQLPAIIKLLKDNHAERRAVLQMWDPITDLGRSGKDLPCNTAVYFKIRNGLLYMTVTNRSNDIVWGCYGANCVHMSMLQEYVASMIGVAVGPYHQVSDSWHAYTEYWEKYGGLDTSYQPRDLYKTDEVQPYPLVSHPESFDDELRGWVEKPDTYGVYYNTVFPFVAEPMFVAWQAHKNKLPRTALRHVERIAASDLRVACQEWLLRRYEAKQERWVA